MRRWASEGVKVQTCVTSPPYFGLRDYGHDGQIGLEETPDEYITAMVEVFSCVKNILADDGTLWLNIGDSYAGNNSQASNNGRASFGNARERVVNRTGEGLKTKDLIGIPWMLAFALRADGWYLRQDIIWHKPNPMPESVTDRCTKAHEYIFLLSKSSKYYYDYEAIQEPAQYWGERDRTNGKYHNEGSGLTPHTGLTGKKKTGIRFGGNKYGDNDDPKHATKSGNEWEAAETRNKRSVWSVTTKPFSGAHFAVFPAELIEPCILAGAPAGGVVLDPFMGSGTTAQVAQSLNRQYLGCELNPEYAPLQKKRLAQQSLILE
jgi:DNA modification methylase